MLKMLTKGRPKCSLNTEIDQGGQQVDRIDRFGLIAKCHLVDRVWSCIEWTRYLTRTFFNQYSRKYIKIIIHQFIGDVYSLVSLVMADHKLAGQMPWRYCKMFSYYCMAIMN